MLNAEKSGKLRPGNFSIRNDDSSAKVLALPAISSSSLLTALKRTGRQICASRVLLLLLLLLLLVLLLLLLLLVLLVGAAMLIDRSYWGLAPSCKNTVFCSTSWVLIH